MSNFSNAHTVTLFDAKKSQPLTGQRLAKIGYKSTKDKETKQVIPPKFPSVCASVPFIDVRNQVTDFTPLFSHIQAMLENAQDGIIRSLYESAEGSLSLVTDSDISIDACIKFLEAESDGGRLTKEFIESWFDNSVSETVTALIIEKLKYSDILTEEQSFTVDKHVKGWKDLYSALAGGKTILQPNQIKNLKMVLELVDSDDTATKLLNRLVKMENKPKMEEMLELF